MQQTAFFNPIRSRFEKSRVEIEMHFVLVAWNPNFAIFLFSEMWTPSRNEVEDFSLDRCGFIISTFPFWSRFKWFCKRLVVLCVLSLVISWERKHFCSCEPQCADRLISFGSHILSRYCYFVWMVSKWIAKSIEINVDC